MNENINAMPPEEQAENDRDARAEELESTFSYDGYQVVRKELFAHLRDPAIVIRKDSITFNTACITGLEDVVYVHVMFNSELKRIVVRGCDENDKDALRWCIAKPDKRKSRKMTCKPFSELVYKEMGWDIKDFPNAYNYYENLITLPLHTCLTDEDVDYVIENFKEVVKGYIGEKD